MSAPRPHIPRACERSPFFTPPPLPLSLSIAIFAHTIGKCLALQMFPLHASTAMIYDHGRLIIVGLVDMRSLLLYCLSTIEKPVIIKKYNGNCVPFVSHIYTDLITASVGSGRDDGLAQARQRFQYGLLLLF